MSNLLENFQQEFVSAILKENQIRKEFLDDIIPAGSLKTAEDSLLAHRNCYLARMSEVLGEIYEGAWFVLGDKLFFELGKMFIDKYPSAYYNLNHYGQEFPQFLSTQKNLSDIPFVASIAKFDWLFQNIFHAKQHVTIEQKKLVELESCSDQSMVFGDAVYLFSSEYSIYQLWEFRNKEYDENFNFNLNCPEQLLLYKKNNEVFVKNISLIHYKLLRLLFDGKTFQSLIEDTKDEESHEIISLFQIIGKTGIVADLK